jgi:hypothetical protein
MPNDGRMKSAVSSILTGEDLSSLQTTDKTKKSKILLEENASDVLK